MEEREGKGGRTRFLKMENEFPLKFLYTQLFFSRILLITWSAHLTAFSCFLSPHHGEKYKIKKLKNEKKDKPKKRYFKQKFISDQSRMYNVKLQNIHGCLILKEEETLSNHIFNFFPHNRFQYSLPLISGSCHPIGAYDVIYTQNALHNRR